MQPSKIFYFYTSLILSYLSLTNARPVQKEVQHPIVQPTWLSANNRAHFPSDGTVRITPENLRETAEWRAIIQKAVSEGRYAVDIDQDSSQFKPEEHFRPLQQFGPTPLAPFHRPPWPPQFEMPTMKPWLPMEPSPQQSPSHIWSDFMENTRRMLEGH